MTTIWPGCLPVSSIRWRHWRICNVQPILSFFFSGIFLVHSVLAFWFLCEMMLKRVTTRNTALSVYISSIATSSQCLACWFFLPLLHAHVHTKKKNKKKERGLKFVYIYIFGLFVLLVSSMPWGLCWAQSRVIMMPAQKPLWVWVSVYWTLAFAGFSRKTTCQHYHSTPFSSRLFWQYCTGHI